jgi:hypothetical protein
MRVQLYMRFTVGRQTPSPYTSGSNRRGERGANQIASVAYHQLCNLATGASQLIWYNTATACLRAKPPKLVCPLIHTLDCACLHALCILRICIDCMRHVYCAFVSTACFMYTARLYRLHALHIEYHRKWDKCPSENMKCRHGFCHFLKLST